MLVTGASLALMIPVFNAYWFWSDEFSGYLVRTVQFAGGMREGHLYPRWCPDFYGGYGSPFFVFYAPLVYFLGAVLTLLTGMPTLAMKLVAALGSLLAGLGTYNLVQQETGRKDAALLAAFVYLATPYRITDLTIRGDLAEFMAISLLPCVLYGYRRLVHEEDPRRLGSCTFITALLHAAMVMSHTLLGLWGTGMAATIALICAVQLWQRRTFSRLKLVPIGFLGGLGLSCIYWLPALVERPFVRTETMAVGYNSPDQQWVSIATLFNNGQFQILPLLALAFLMALVASVRRRKVGIEWVWIAGATALVFLILPHASFIWRKDLIPFGRMIQFPWRLIGPAALCAAVALGLSWAKALPRKLTVNVAAALLGLATFVGVGLERSKVNPMPPSAAMETREHIRRSMTATTAMDEYLPKAVTARPRKPAEQLAQNSEYVKLVENKSKRLSHTLEFVAKQATSLELALHDYPGWSVQTLSGPESVDLTASPTGLVNLQIPAAGRYRVTVSFGSSPIRRAAALISAIVFLGFVGLVVLQFRAWSRGSAPSATIAPLPITTS